MAGPVAVLAAVLLALALFLALLAIPVRFVFRVERSGTTRTSWRMRWLFGLVDVQSGRRRAPRKRKPPRAETPEVERRRTRGPTAALATLRTRGFLRCIARLLAGLRRRIRFEDFHLRAEFGLDDPADTGRLYGAIAPLLLAAAGMGWHVDCRPTFLRSGLEGSCAATFRVRPLSIIGQFVRFFCSPPVLRAIRVWRSKR
ncbi:MAG TPA: hypothetical protein VLD67_06415 [Vicinamibacterales bacterium]|nr:hypothetical protein [Vicinamibacterales bacterium]